MKEGHRIDTNYGAVYVRPTKDVNYVEVTCDNLRFGDLLYMHTILMCRDREKNTWYVIESPITKITPEITLEKASERFELKTHPLHDIKDFVPGWVSGYLNSVEGWRLRYNEAVRVAKKTIQDTQDYIKSLEQTLDELGQEQADGCQ